MNPWTVLGWILVAAAALAPVVEIVGFLWFARERRRMLADFERRSAEMDADFAERRREIHEGVRPSDRRFRL
jgi:hypothetical protein